MTVVPSLHSGAQLLRALEQTGPRPALAGRNHGPRLMNRHPSVWVLLAISRRNDARSTMLAWRISTTRSSSTSA